MRRHTGYVSNGDENPSSMAMVSQVPRFSARAEWYVRARNLCMENWNIEDWRRELRSLDIEWPSGLNYFFTFTLRIHCYV